MDTSEAENGTTPSQEWDHLARKYGESAVVDRGDRRGLKNRYIQTLADLTLDGLLPEDHPLRVLDFGCGAGRQAIRQARWGHRVVGLDISSEMIRIAEARRAGLPVEFVLFDDGGDLPLADGRLDVVTTAGVLMYILEDDRLDHVLQEFHRVLRPGGEVILIEHIRRFGRISRAHHKVYRSYLAYDRALRRAGFAPLRVRPLRRGRLLPSWFGLRFGLLPAGCIEPLARFELLLRAVLPLWDYYDCLYHFRKAV